MYVRTYVRTDGRTYVSVSILYPSITLSLAVSPRKGFQIFHFLDFQIFRFSDFQIFGFLDFWIFGFYDFLIFGFSDFNCDFTQDFEEQR